MSQRSRPPSRPCSGREEMQRKSVSQQQDLRWLNAGMQALCGCTRWTWCHLHISTAIWHEAPLRLLCRAPQIPDTRSNVCSREWLLDDEWDIGSARYWNRKFEMFLPVAQVTYLSGAKHLWVWTSALPVTDKDPKINNDNSNNWKKESSLLMLHCLQDWRYLKCLWGTSVA